MHSIEWPIKGWKTKITRLSLVFLLVQALGLSAVWPQDSAQPRIEDEATKQNRIYQSRGADVPGGYVTNRGLLDYAGFLSPGFCDTLDKLGTADRWLDIGAGAGRAILEYYAAPDAAAPAGACSRPGGLASAVAMSIEDRRTDRWHQLATSLGTRLRYVSGKALRHYSIEELGQFSLITDVYGGFSYTEDMYRFMEKVLNLLQVSGRFYSILQYVNLESAQDSPGTEYQTELVDADGRGEKICTWLKKISCVQVTCDSKSAWDPPTEQINIRKICSDISVPPMKLMTYQAGNPPNRRFQLER